MIGWNKKAAFLLALGAGVLLLCPFHAAAKSVSLTQGAHSITAYYSGDDSFYASVSASVLQRVGLFFTALGPAVDGSFSLTGSGAPGQSCVLDGAEALLMPMNWIPVVTNVADTNGVFFFSRPISQDERAHFFRLRLP